MKTSMLGTTIAILLFSITLTNTSFADNSPITEIIPINSSMGIEKTTLNMFVSPDNKLPWGFVEGKINNAVLDYPIIIQIYDNDDSVSGNAVGAVHFAQTSVNDDGTYEYKFRVLDSDGKTIKHIFSGSYTVKIFKVVYLNNFNEL